MTEPMPVEDAPEGEEESGLTDQELDALADDDEEPKDMRAIRKMRAQNKRSRHRLRESDANRQAAEDARSSDLARLAAYEQQAIERAAAQVLADPADLMRLADEETVRSFNDNSDPLSKTK